MRQKIIKGHPEIKFEKFEWQLIDYISWLENDVTDRFYSEPLPKFSVIIKGKPKFLTLFLWNICPFWRSGKKASQWGTRIQIGLSNAVTKYFIIGRISTFAFAVFANDTVRYQRRSRLNWKPGFAETNEPEIKR